MKKLSFLSAVLISASISTFAIAQTSITVTTPSSTPLVSGKLPVATSDHTVVDSTTGIGSSGNNVCPANSDCSPSGTTNFLGPVQVGGTLQNFPASGNILGASDTATVTGKSIDASQLTGTVPAGRLPALTGDVTSSAGSAATTVTQIQGQAVTGTQGTGSVLFGTGTNITTGNFASGVIDPDPALAANSNSVIATQAATKSYTDNAAQGLVYKNPALLATTGNITLSGEQTIDGTLTSSSAILVKDQTDTTQNGIYVSASGAWARRSDANTGLLLKSATLLISSGSVNANSTWNCSCVSITIGTSPIVFVKVSGSNVYTASNGVQIIGNQFSADSTVARLTATQTLTNKSISGSTNTLTAIPNSALTNSSINIAGHSVALGATQAIACGDLSNGGTACPANTGTSGHVVPFLDGNNTESGNNSHTGTENFTNINQSQTTIFTRHNPNTSPFQASCGDLISAEGMPGNAPLTVTLPPPPLANDCTVELHPFPGDIYADPNGGHIKTDDIDRLTTKLWIPGSVGKPTFTLRYGVSGWEWRSIGVVSPPSAIWRFNGSNGQVFFDHDAQNSRLRLCPLNGGGLNISSQITYVPPTCVYAPDSAFTSTPNRTTPIYAARTQGALLTATGTGPSAGCPDTGPICLTTNAGNITFFQTGNPITAVNFFGTPLANVYEDPHTIKVDTTHIEITDQNYVAPETFTGLETDPNISYTALRNHSGNVVLDPINLVLINDAFPFISFVGNVQTDASGNVSQVSSQYNGSSSLPLTTVANLPASPVGIQLASDEGCGSALLYGDTTNWRRSSDGQVVSTNCGSRGLLSRFHNRASDKLQNIVEQTYQNLKDTGLLPSGTCTAHCLTGLWMFANPNQNDSLFNWINPGTCDLTVTGSPTFTANKGYTGVSGALLSGCSETALGGTEDDFALGTYVLTPSASAATIMGQNAIGSGRRVYLQSAPSGALALTTLNSNNGDPYTPARYTGMFTLIRDPASVGTLTAALEETTTNITRGSAPQTVQSISFLGTNDVVGTEYSTAQLAFAYAGHLTSADLVNLRAALEDYFLVQLGAVTPTVANLPPAANFKGQTYLIPNLGGGAGLLQSDGTNWGRTDQGGYEVRILATGLETITSLTNACNVEYTANLTGNVSVTLSGTDAKGTTVKKGACFRITLDQSAPGAFTFAVKDGPSTNTLITFGSATNKSAAFFFSGTNWRLMQDGAL